MKHGTAYFLEGVGFLGTLWYFLWSGSAWAGVAVLLFLVLLVQE